MSSRDDCLKELAEIFDGSPVAREFVKRLAEFFEPHEVVLITRAAAASGLYQFPRRNTHAGVKMQTTYCDSCKEEITGANGIRFGRELAWKTFRIFSLTAVQRETNGDSETMRSADLCLKCLREMFKSGQLLDSPK